jgi:hypothetical protein
VDGSHSQACVPRELISQSAELLAMVEILLSLLLLIAAIALAIWPYAVIHDHTIDGLFLTLTGSMLTLLFLLNFIWRLRFQGAKEVTAIRHVITASPLLEV